MTLARRCTRCAAIKPIAAFGVSTSRKDRTDASCRPCRRRKAGEYNRTRRDYSGQNARRRAQYAAEPSRRLGQNRAWEERAGFVRPAKTPEQNREYAERYWAKQPITKAEYNRRFKPPPEAKAIYNRRRRAQRRGVHAEVVSDLVLLELGDGVCGICGEDVDPFEFHVDHIVALSRGGHHNYENTQVAHPACNLRKGTRFVPPVQERN